jgi:hypothetical protein
VAGLKCGLFVSKADEDVGVIMRPARRTRYAVERNNQIEFINFVSDGIKRI